MTKSRTRSAAADRSALARLTLTALFSAIIAVCAWVQVPFDVPFTLQTFGVFAALLFLGGKYGTLSVLVYVLLGAVGAPVFSGFRGGVGALLGATGGYISGFLLGALFYWGMEVLLARRGRFGLPAKILTLVGSLALCYLFGTVWFTVVHEGLFTLSAFASSLSLCVLPFLLPDAGKLALAALLYRRLGRRIG